jgi:hypothetical protein
MRRKTEYRTSGHRQQATGKPYRKQESTTETRRKPLDRKANTKIKNAEDTEKNGTEKSRHRS